jgi:hypothetical protein
VFLTGSGTITRARRCGFPIYEEPCRQVVKEQLYVGEIFSNDDERQHSFKDALSSYVTLLRTYGRFGYQSVLVSKLDVAARADFVLNH